MSAAFQLPPEPVIEFDEENHQYYVDGEATISVTQVLKAAAFVDDTWFTDYGRWRGSAAHRACELADRGNLDKKTVDPDIAPYLEGWRKYQKESGFRPALIEQQVVSVTYGYAGTLDRTGSFAKSSNDAPVIIDLKTYDAPWWAALQLAAYGHASDPEQVFRRLAVVLKGDGNYSVVEYPMDTYHDDLHDFLAALRTVRCRQRHS